MKAIVHQALGNVINGYSRLVLENTGIENTFMRDKSFVSAIQDRIRRLQFFRDVICIEYGDFGSTPETRCPHHTNVHPGDRQDQSAAVWRSTDHTRTITQYMMTR